MIRSRSRPETIVRRLSSIPISVAGRMRPEAGNKPPWERSVLEDISARRPWNVVVKLARQGALLRVGHLRDGVTVVIVNWNTSEVTADVVRAVQALSPADTQILVVDNGSTDGSRSIFRSWPQIRALLLPSNVGHGVALDLAVCATRTKVTVTLDSDAIPLTEGWLEPAVNPIREGRAVLAGLRSRRDFVHPVYSAVDTAAFLRRRLSFQPFLPPGIDGPSAAWGREAWDTSELLTRRLGPDEVHLIDRTENAVPGLPGMTTAGVVYHHGGVSRTALGSVDQGALQGWREACSRLRALNEGGRQGGAAT